MTDDLINRLRTRSAGSIHPDELCDQAADALERLTAELAEKDSPSMLQATIHALAEIDAALGLPEDGCNSTARTLAAIRLLHAVHRDDSAHIERLTAELAEARSSLRELVAVEDLKKSLAQANHHATRFPSDENYAVIDQLSAATNRRRHAACEAAGAAIAAEQQKAGEKGK